MINYNLQKKPLLTSVSNFRDLGGYCNPQGLRIKKNLIFRSNFFLKLSQKDLEKLKKFGIKTIVDFRGSKESQLNKYKNYSKLSIKKYSKPIETKSSVDLYNLFMSGRPTEKKVSELMVASYREYVSDFTDNYRFLFSLIANKENLPLIFHCTAGKDRTGLASALILSCLNFSYQDIIKDYLLTNKLWNTTIKIPRKASNASINAMLRAETKYISSSFEQAKEIYGSTDGYLKNGLKINKNKKEKIILNLMEKIT